jgi:hypothetical protein
MYSYLECVRRKLVSLAKEVFDAVPDTRVGVVTYGDYCDAGSTYVTKVKDLTDVGHYRVQGRVNNDRQDRN